MQVTDKRELEFDADALRYCLSVSPRASHAIGLPAMPPGEVRFAPGRNMVEIQYGSGNTEAVIGISAASLGALLVSYCVRAKILFPRTAEKRIRVEADAVVVELLLKLDRAPSPETNDSEEQAAEALRGWKWDANSLKAE